LTRVELARILRREAPAYQLEGTTIEAFDLLEYQKRARETCCPKTLFQLWEDVCRRYDQHEIGEYQFEEMKAVIWPNLTALASLRRAINDTDRDVRQSKEDTRKRA
jgi:hypothetical protein